MSDTPRTDAALRGLAPLARDEFTRRLERELNTARKPSQSAREVVSEQRGFVEKPEVAWLIEFGGSGPRRAWWGRDRGYVGRWTENPNVAVRFARRKDAERACELLEISPPPIITEHVWFSRDHTYADTLGNESSPNLDPTAGLGPSDLMESAAAQPPVTSHRSMPGPSESLDSTNGDIRCQPCETGSGDKAVTAADPAVAGPMFIAGRPSPEEEAEHIRIAKESSSLLQSAGKESVAAQVPAQPDSGALSEVPHPQPAATDPTPEARELTADAVDAAENELIAAMSDPTVKQAEALDLLRDGAMSAVQLQQALARAQERINVLNWLEACAKKTGIEVTFGADGNMQVTHGTFQKDLERAEAELAKVRAERDVWRHYALRQYRDLHPSPRQFAESHLYSAVEKGVHAVLSAAKEGQPDEQGEERK